MILDPMLTSDQLGFHTKSGRRSFHIQKHTCASCGYPAAKMRKCTPSSPRPSFYPLLNLPNFLVSSLNPKIPFTHLTKLLPLFSTSTRLTKKKKQTTGAKKQNTVEPQEPDACAISSTWRENSRMDSRLGRRRARGGRQMRRRGSLMFAWCF